MHYNRTRSAHGLIALAALIGAALCLLIALVAPAAAAPVPGELAGDGQLYTEAAPAAAPALSWSQALLAGVVPMIVALVRGVVPSIPKVWLPILAAGAGALGDLALSWASGGAVSPGLGIALGLAGVGLREATKQVRASFEGAVARVEDREGED